MLHGRVTRPIVLALIVAAAFLLAQGNAAAPSTFRIAMDSDTTTLDPAQNLNGTWDAALAYVAEPLLTIDREGNLAPALATAWSTSPDGSTVTFHLRPGVSFQDGTQFDAEAAKWNIERLIDPDVRTVLHYPLRSIGSVEVVDTYTVRLHLTLPASDPVPALSTTFASMLSPASATKHGNTRLNIVWPVGTGPYRMVGYRKDAKLVVGRFDSYWGKKPYYDQVEFQVVPNVATRHTLLLAGQTDMIVAPAPSELPTLQDDPRVKVLMAPGDTSFFVALNTSKPPLDDKRVRQALNYAVDKRAIIHNILHDTATLMDSVVAPSVSGYAPFRPYSYDPVRARSLLKEAGIAPSDLTLQLLLPTSHYADAVTIGQAIAGQLEALGAHVTIQTMDWPTYVGAFTKPKAENRTELFVLGMAPPDMAATAMMEGFDCTWTPPQGQNFEFYCNPQVQKLITAAFTEPDFQKRNQGYAKAMRIIWNDAPRIWLWVEGHPLAYAKDVTNIWGLPNGQFFAEYAHPAD